MTAHAPASTPPPPGAAPATPPTGTEAPKANRLARGMEWLGENLIAKPIMGIMRFVRGAVVAIGLLALAPAAAAAATISKGAEHLGFKPDPRGHIASISNVAAETVEGVRVVYDTAKKYTADLAVASLAGGIRGTGGYIAEAVNTGVEAIPIIGKPIAKHVFGKKEEPSRAPSTEEEASE